jgi:hypothetical protein
MYKRKLVFLILLFVFIALFATLHIYLTKKVRGASMSAATLTISNSRMSYKARISSGTSGQSVVTILNSGPDINTNHLFPGDVVCFTDAGQNGCTGNTTYTVSSIVDATHFNVTVPLGANLDGNGYVVATQSGSWTIAFTTVAQVPNGGSLVVTVPMADSVVGNNSIPDSAAATPSGGFDIGTLGPSNIIVSAGCTPANWGTSDMATIATGSGSTDHVFTWARSTACVGSTAITVTIGGPGVVNPAPVTAHYQGNADVYGITIQTKDGGGNVIDYVVPRAAPVEAVLISGTVDETLNFIVSGMSSGSSYCGNNASVSATATSIPWGHPVTNTFVYAAQQLTVNTNAASGYTVTIEESDQMGRNGNVCTGTTPAVDGFTFGSGKCIRDTLCAASACTDTTAADWTSPTVYPGLGYSLASQSGTDAPFFWSEKTRVWSAKPLPDKQGGDAVQSIMSNSGPVSGSSIYVCYKLAISGTQPSGYYYNIAKYTATATF